MAGWSSFRVLPLDRPSDVAIEEVRKGYVRALMRNIVRPFPIGASGVRASNVNVVAAAR
ncbi:MAG: hypothetical protein U0787_11805 [Polyangia bacterium]